MEKSKPRLIAFYLPQYHPIPENDEWWGKGFTEWTNVAKAKPLFKGHNQPHFPADLGFYDLRIPEVRQAQADLAQQYGIYGFCYWHYWFAGKRLLDRPLNEVLESGKPDFPFCLAWANESWTGVWDGEPGRILLEQTYPGLDDYYHHFREVLKSFKDPRYIYVEGKPVFIVYQPHQIPDSNLFIKTWQGLAIEAGLKGIFFIGMGNPNLDHRKLGFDGLIINNLFYATSLIKQKQRHNIFARIFRKILKIDLWEILRKARKRPLVFSYNDFVACGLYKIQKSLNQFPSVFPNWDNTPRSQNNGRVLLNSTPELFKVHLKKAVNQVSEFDQEKQLIFLKSWNEWAEGNYLEPDQQFGLGYLEAIQDVLSGK